MGKERRRGTAVLWSAEMGGERCGGAGFCVSPVASPSCPPCPPSSCSHLCL